MRFNFCYVLRHKLKRGYRTASYRVGHLVDSHRKSSSKNQAVRLLLKMLYLLFAGIDIVCVIMAANATPISRAISRARAKVFLRGLDIMDGGG